MEANYTRGMARVVRLGSLRIPLVLAVLMGLTIVTSIAAAMGLRNGLPLAEWGVFVPALVWKGQVWRLVTWIFYELEPIGLIFAVLMLYWFGRELLERWGTGRFLGVYFGITALAAGLTTLIARFLWPEMWTLPFLGLWPIAEALVIAWATLFPEREIALYLVLRVKGKYLVPITVGLTVLFALFYGFDRFIPHFLAEGMMLLYMGQLRRGVLKWRLKRLERQKRRYVDNVIRLDRRERDRDDEPPTGKPPRWLN